MRPTCKDFAEFFRLGLRSRLCQLRQVASWAYDALHHRYEERHKLFELCYCVVRPTARVELLLGSFSESITPEMPVLMLLGYASHLVREGMISPETLLIRLYCVASLPEFPEHIYHELSALEDAYLLARDGIYSSMEEIGRDFAAFVANYECYAPIMV